MLFYNSIHNYHIMLFYKMIIISYKSLFFSLCMTWKMNGTPGSHHIYADIILYLIMLFYKSIFDVNKIKTVIFAQNLPILEIKSSAYFCFSHHLWWWRSWFKDMTFMIITISLMDLVNQILLMMLIVSQGLNDNGGDDIYFMMKILCVCHEKWSLPISPSWAPEARSEKPLA